MLEKILKYFKIVEIDVYVYSMKNYRFFHNYTCNFEIQKDIIKSNVKRYSIKRDSLLVHQSFLYERAFLLRLLNETGPVIGNCFTNSKFRGQSIYPYVLNYIAKEQLLEDKVKQIFVIVNKNNISSIKGIEKAGFQKYSSISSKRWLIWYFNKNIQLFN